jgi:hypothetical protein
MSSIKGDLGEERVSFLLSELDKKDYRVESNVTMLDAESESFNIDHIVLSIYGIFVIETKNLKGEIQGNDSMAHWNQKVNGQKYKIYSPVKQNYGHIKHLRELLSKGIKIVSIICFTERSDLIVESKYATIVHTMDLVKAIKAHRKVVFSYEQLNYLVSKIRTEVKKYEDSNISHVGLMQYKRQKANSNNADNGLLEYIDKVAKIGVKSSSRESIYHKSLLEYIDKLIRR